MLLTTRCPNCKRQFNADLRGRGTREEMLKCPNCKHKIKFVPGKPKEEPTAVKQALQTIGEKINQLAVKTGVAAMLHGTRKPLIGAGALAGLVVVVLGVLYLAGFFAPEVHVPIGGIPVTGGTSGTAGTDGGHAHVQPKVAKDKPHLDVNAPSAQDDPLGHHRFKLHDPSPAVKAKAARALGLMGADA